jgi:hypothetical protein
VSRRTEVTADRLARWGYSQGSGRSVARAFGVAPSRVAHWKTDDPNDPLTRVCAALLECEDDGAASGIMGAVTAAYERRPLLSAPTPVLMSRWSHLWAREHEMQATEARQAALYLGGGVPAPYAAALLSHAAVQIEMAELVDEIEARGVDARAILLQEPTGRAPK